jgi:peroxiredoxin
VRSARKSSEPTVTDAKMPSQTATTLSEALKETMTLKASLGERLDHYAADTRRISPLIATEYDRLIQRLSAIEPDAIAPSIGEAMPPFVLPDQHGHLVGLETLLERGPLVVSFNRGNWCSYCRLELLGYAEAYDEIVALGGEVVAILPELGAGLHALTQKQSVPFRLLSDVDLDYTLSLGLAIWVGDTHRDLLMRNGIDLSMLHGNDKWFLPIPATFILDASGIVIARHVEPEFRHRMEIEIVLDVLRKIAAERVDANP